MSNVLNSSIVNTEGSYLKLLKNFPFIAYLISLFLGAFNDNAYKTVVMLIALSQLDTGYVDFYFIGAQLVFILPYLLCTGYAGYLADIYSKTTVFIATKLFEVFIMLLVLFFLPTLNKTALIAILFLLSAQSVFFSPAKYGILPEIFDESEISRANGLLELATFVSIILGTAFGGILMQYFADNNIIIAISLFILSLVGFGLSFFIPKVKSSGSKKEFKLNPWYEVNLGIKQMRKNNILTLSILGITLFFAMALALTTNLLVFGKEFLHLENYQLGILNAIIGLGIGIGSCIAGWLSGDKIEYGLIPFGLLGIAFCCFFVSFSTNILYVCLILLLVGIMAGIFVVPLHALLQEIPHKHQKGRLISTNNFFNGVGMIIAIMFLWFLQLTLTPEYIMMVFGVVLFGFNIIALIISPLFFVRFLLWLLVHTIYRVKVRGKLEIPYKGPAVIVANKISALDGLLISIALPRFVRYFVPDNIYQHPFFKLILKFVKAIPYDPNNIDNFATSAQKAREALVKGHLVCIFKDENLDVPKSNIPFEVFYDSVVSDLDIPVFPIHIDQTWDGIIAYNNYGKTRLAIPEQFPVDVTLTLGPKLHAIDTKAQDIKIAMQNLAQQAMLYEEFKTHKNKQYIENYLAKDFIKTATTHPYRTAVVDNLGYKISYHKLSNYVLALSKLFKKDENLAQNKAQSIGLIIPNSFFNILSNLALSFAGYEVVNLDINNLDKTDKLIKKYNIKNIISVSWFINNSNFALKNLNVLDIEKYYKKILSNNFCKTNFVKYLVPSKYIIKIYGEYYLDLNFKVAKFENAQLSLTSLKNKIKQSKKFLGISRHDNFLSVTSYSQMDSYLLSFWLPIIVGAKIVSHTNFNIKNIDILNEFLIEKDITVLIGLSNNFNKYIALSYNGIKNTRLVILLNHDTFATLDTKLTINLNKYFSNAYISISTYSDEQNIFLLGYKENNNNYECSLES